MDFYKYIPLASDQIIDDANIIPSLPFDDADEIYNVVGCMKHVLWRSSRPIDSMMKGERTTETIIIDPLTCI